MKTLNENVNPLLVKELRDVMRNPRVYTVFVVYLASISAIALLLYMGLSLTNPTSRVGNSSQVGTTLFYALVGAQVILVCLVAPAFTIGAVTHERRQHTLDLLKATLLSPIQITLAKWIPSFGLIALLILATIPLTGLVFVLGGVELTQWAAALCVITSSASLFTSLGLFISSRSHSTFDALVITYSLLAGMVIGLAILMLTAPALSASGGRMTAAGSSALTVLFVLLAGLNPITALVITEANFHQSSNLLTVVIGPSMGFVAPLTLPAPFLTLAVCYLAATIVLLWLTARTIRVR
ncbi:MAG: hypothetical protein RMN25_10295 [Anaerolineae bacterium]|nr:ABC transporter permease [Thermoflexales bacterium]MDW8408157.1 hypothetical protein [Anaerolineae bacterium]